MRKIVKTTDVELLFGKKKRQANHLLRKVREACGKAPHQPVTINDFAAYYGLTAAEIEDVIRYNDN